MGNHRADRRGLRRASSRGTTPAEVSIDAQVPATEGFHTSSTELSVAAAPVAGRRIKTTADTPTSPTSPTARASRPAGHRSTGHAHVASHAAKQAAEPVVGAAVVSPLDAPAAPGRRRAAKHSGSRGALFKSLPSAPVLLGVAALAVSAGGAVTAADPALVGSGLNNGVHHASAMSGTSRTSSTSLLNDRTAAISRDSRRDALADKASAELVAAAEAQEEQRNAALAKFATRAQAFAKKIAANAWVYPLNNVSLTATFGEYGLWSSYHTGLDFNGNTGDPIMAVAGGTVTSVGYDGAYGYKTVITLEDGTEIWYAHQDTYNVTEGQTVRAGEVIGTVGSTGNVTGSHLHLEVRPGAGDPVDPYAALQVHGLF